MDGLWEMDLGPDALWGPVGPWGIFVFGSLLLYVQKLQVNDFISLMIYEPFSVRYTYDLRICFFLPYRSRSAGSGLRILSILLSASRVGGGFPAIPPKNPRYWAACQLQLHLSFSFVATLPLELRQGG